jgi:type I restriction enzyme M protein
VFEQVFKNIDDVLRKEAGCTTELDYTEQTSWLLFLKYLDASTTSTLFPIQWRGRGGSFFSQLPNLQPSNVLCRPVCTTSPATLGYGFAF